ncbi:MAG: LptA/OstA family protein, partial [Victivallaceae bacterium]|nr:LptA/OstA family protein [Victivallaceae bacterium]
NEKVFFRSPQLDLNGIGFTANFNTRTIKVLEDVDILIRASSYKKDAKEKSDTVIKAKSDSMTINMEKELVTLTGNVKVDEASFNIFCDRLELDLKKNKQDKTDKAEQNQDEGLTPGGVSQITCIGNVKIIRKMSDKEKQENGSQKAFADKAVYKTADEQIILTGKNPQIYRGSDMISGEKIILWKKSERLQVFKNCLVKMTAPQAPEKKETELNSDFIDFDYANNLGVFTGHVRVKNADFKLNSNKITIYLEDRAKPKKDLEKSLIAASGKKDLKEIICTGDVVIRRMNSEKNEKALAGNAVYTLKENKIILSGNSPLIISGTDSVSGKKMLVWLDQNRLKVTKNSKIIINQDSISPKGGTGKTTVTSDSSDLNYGGNELSFSGSVKIDNPQMNLVCDNMKIFLDEPEKTKKPPETGMSLISSGDSGGKDVNRIVCTGSVRVDDPRAALNCDRMVITFRDRPAGKLASSLGSLGGGSKREVDLIKCFGSVYMLNKPEDPKTAPATLSSDDAILNIPGNVADLLGNVKIEEPRFQLTCKKMKMLAKDITPAQAAAHALKNREGSLNTIPEHIAIGDTKELTRIICLEKVVMTRKLPDELQRACGDKAVYEVSEHNVTLTGGKNKPTLQRGPTVMEGERIILWTDSERLDIKDGTLKNFVP